MEALRALLDWGRVRLEGLRSGDSPGASGAKSPTTVVGRVVAGGAAPDREEEAVVEVSLAMALQAVQRSLRQQGKPPLQVSEKTLIAQLEAEGLLLDRAGRPIVAGQAGNRSHQVRIERRRLRVVRMRLGDLLGSDDRAGGESPEREDCPEA